MNRAVWLGLVVWVSLATACCCPAAGARPTATATPRASPTAAAWVAYSTPGVTVYLPGEDAVLPGSDEGYLFNGVVTSDDMTYELYVSNQGNGYGSTIAELEGLRGEDPNRTVLSEGEGKAGARDYYRIVYVANPPQPDGIITALYLFFQPSGLIAVEFVCPPADIARHYAQWDGVIARMEVK